MRQSMSALARIADLERTSSHVGDVPTADIGAVSERFGAAYVSADRTDVSTLLIAALVYQALCRV